MVLMGLVPEVVGVTENSALEQPGAFWQSVVAAQAVYVGAGEVEVTSTEIAP